MLARRLLVATLILVLGASATGLGATSATRAVPVDVEPTISLIMPAAGSILPGSTQPDIDGVSFNGSTLSLGQITLGEMSTAGLRYRVDTNSPFGYELQIANPGTAPVMRAGANSIADLGAAGQTLTMGSVTGFGISLQGDGSSQANVAGPWGSDGTLFRGVPAAPSYVLGAASAGPSGAGGDVYDVTFAVNLDEDDPVEVADYSGSVRLTAITL